jgi:hypothetical protein
MSFQSNKKTKLFSAKSYGFTGPGGWKCFCCGPAPSERKKFVRLHKRRVTRLLDKFESVC